MSNESTADVTLGVDATASSMGFSNTNLFANRSTPHNSLEKLRLRVLASAEKLRSDFAESVDSKGSDYSIADFQNRWQRIRRLRAEFVDEQHTLIKQALSECLEYLRRQIPKRQARAVLAECDRSRCLSLEIAKLDSQISDILTTIDFVGSTESPISHA